VPSHQTRPLPLPNAWLSGQSETDTTANGSFAAWRGRDVEICGSWAPIDTAGNAIDSPDWFIGPGGAYQNIPVCDWAIGAMITGAGETWASAASGSYDTRWRDQLLQLKASWGARAAANMYIRFAHEFNGNWYPWTVTDANKANFITAWQRFYGLVQTHFPGAKTVWCPNPASSYTYTGGTGIGGLYPGDAYVDVVATDWYNQWPHTTTAAAAQVAAEQTQDGGPSGVESYRAFAEAHGKPFALGEWSNPGVDNGDGGGGGDAPEWFQWMHDWLVAHAGTGPGQVIYEVLLNIPSASSARFDVYPVDIQPLSSARYALLW
jgi:glycosyl hydrolase family 26